MYEEEIYFRNCYLNCFDTLDPGDLDLEPSDPKSIRHHCYPGWMCGTSLRKVGQGVLELLIRNGFDTIEPGNLDL